MTPQMPPTYIMPGMPRFRLPDFSVRVSPVEPYSRGILCITALGKKETKSNILLLLLPGFFQEIQLVADKEFAANDKEQDDAR